MATRTARTRHDGNSSPFDLPAMHIYKVWGGQIHEIEAMGFTRRLQRADRLGIAPGPSRPNGIPAYSRDSATWVDALHADFPS